MGPKDHNAGLLDAGSAGWRIDMALGVLGVKTAPDRPQTGFW